MHSIDALNQCVSVVTFWPVSALIISAIKCGVSLVVSVFFAVIFLFLAIINWKMQVR